MRAERALVGMHGAAVVLALGAATLLPRAGQAALLVPLATSDLGAVLDWADREGAPLLELDTAKGRVIARMADNHSLLSAVSAGILPVAADTRGCQPGRRR